MKRSEVVRLAYEAGCKSIIVPEEWFRFANLVAAAEREKFCSDLRALHDVYSLQSVSTIHKKGYAMTESAKKSFEGEAGSVVAMTQDNEVKLTFMQHPWVEVVNEDGDVWILDSVLEVGRIEAATKAGLSVTPLYKKKEWQGLTDQEMLDTYAPNRIPDSAYSNMSEDLKKIHYFAREEMLSGLRAIEAKLKEKNT